MALLPALREVARKVARTEIMPLFASVVAQRKADGSLLTEADLAAQQALVHALPQLAAFPVLGEEMSRLEQEKLWCDSASGLWVVDPIDGTSCFLNGLHTWCLSLAIVADGEPVIGVVYDPNHRELFHALRGHGAWLNDAPIRPHPAATVREGVMGVGTSHRVTPADFLPFLQALLSDGGMFIRNGSGALMSAWAAAGRLIGYYEPHMNPWDALPGLVLMREAGGASNDFLAQEGIQRGNPLLLASQTLYPQLKKMIPQPLH